MNGLAVNKLNEEVMITCYGKTEKKTRREGLEDQVGWGGSTPLFPTDIYQHYKAISEML